MAPAEAKSGALMGGLLLVGVALLLGAAWPAGSHIAFLSRATITEARIVDFHLVPRSRDSGRLRRVAIYEFALPDGSLQQAVGPMCSKRGCSERVGTILRVGYDPADPGSVRRLGFHDAWALPAALGGFGALWMAIWGLGAWLGVREARLLRATERAASGRLRRRQDGGRGADDLVVVLSVVIGIFALGAVAAALGGFPWLAVALVGFGLFWLLLGWLVSRDQG
ncbi:DUF3592 domain-containing protein [Roseomonas fluvialis]|nr:DUF3592 domain-containing protein [Roseomonas fluvialis]